MPRVEQRVEERPAPTPNLPSGDTPEISGIGQPEKTAFNMEGVNKVVDALIQKEIERVDEAVGLDNDLKMSLVTDAIEESAKRHRGRDAGLALDESRKNFPEAAEKIRKESVKTRGQEDRFNRSLARNTLKLETNIGSHVSREHDSYYRTAYEASKIRLKDEAGKNPEIFDANMKEIAETNRKFKETNGLSDEWLKNTIMQDNADMVNNAITQHENNDNPQAALDVFNKYKGDIPEKDRLGVGERLKKETDKKQGRDFAISIYTKEKTTEQMYAETDKWAGSNEDKRDAARRETDRTVATAEKSKKQTEEAAWNLINLRAIEVIRQGRTPNENDFSAALRKGIEDADSEGWRKQLEAWQRSPKSNRETSELQSVNFNAIYADKPNWKYMSSNEFKAFVISEGGKGNISQKHVFDLMKMYENENPLNAPIAKRAISELNTTYTRMIANTADEDEKKAIGATWSEKKQMLDDFIMNNHALEVEEYRKKMNIFIEEVVNPAKADFWGRVIDNLSSGAPYKDVAEKKKREKLRGLAGEPASGMQMGKTPLMKPGPSKEVKENEKRRQAIELLKKNKRPITENNIKWLMERLK